MLIAGQFSVPVDIENVKRYVLNVRREPAKVDGETRNPLDRNTPVAVPNAVNDFYYFY